MDDWTCELSVGVDTSGHSPVVIMCRKPAKLYRVPWFGPWEIPLCDDHKDWTPPKQAPAAT